MDFLHKLIYCFFIFGSMISDSQPALTEIPNLDSIKSQIPENFLPPELKNATMPSAEDAKKLIQEKCRKITGDDLAYENVEAASATFVECVSGLVNITKLEQEIKEAQPIGNLDSVFNSYCIKRTIAIECMKNYSTSIEPCLEDEEKEHKTIFINIFTNLLNFVCHKDGDQIALFIAEKGPECFTDKKDALIACINSTFAGYIPEDKPDISSLPQLIMGKKQCDEMTVLQQCVVNELEKCEESTPANLVESMFKFIRNETPCVNYTNGEDKSGSINIHQSSIIFVFTSTMFLGLTAKLLI